MKIEIIAVAPNDGWAFFKKKKKNFLIRPPHFISSSIEVSDKIVQNSIDLFGFEECSKIFKNENELVIYLKQEYVKFKKKNDIETPSSEEIRLLLNYAPDDVLENFLKKAEELILRQKYEIAESIASDILKLENIENKPLISERAKRIKLKLIYKTPTLTRDSIITIYGAYFPEKEKKRLEILRDSLTINGFRNLKLVSDHSNNYFPFRPSEDKNTYFHKRSCYCLDNSDLNIFIFTFKGTKGGVIMELDYAIENKMPFLILVEEKNGVFACSQLIVGALKKISINLIPFPKDDDKFLFDIAYQRLFDKQISFNLIPFPEDDNKFLFDAANQRLLELIIS